MNIKENFKTYFNELPNKWSANFLAFMGFNNILLALVGYVISVVYQFAIPNETLKLILATPVFLSVYAIAFLPVSCVIALILLIPFKILLKTNNSKVFKLNLILLLLFLLTCYILLTPFFDFTSGSAIYIVFIPIILFWIPISILAIYLFLLWLENYKKLKIQNSILLENKYYKKYLKIFFIYGFVLFGIIELLLFLIGVIVFLFNV
ncbi:MAG: hypothetical protein E7Z89_07040 [Cyanobacteria bacterium SIG28]|nr:hypothetical protein [Cyanobacteria bacterium SIG28]